MGVKGHLCFTRSVTSVLPVALLPQGHTLQVKANGCVSTMHLVT